MKANHVKPLLRNVTVSDTIPWKKKEITLAAEWKMDVRRTKMAIKRKTIWGDKSCPDKVGQLLQRDAVREK